MHWNRCASNQLRSREIIRNAVEAGTRDPRFPPVTIEELNELDFSVDVLTEPEPAEYHELDPKKYGIIVRSGLRSGCCCRIWKG